MSILKKRNILKLAATFMLMGMMAGAFTMHTRAAVAATAGACDPGTDILGSATSGTPNCDLTVIASPFDGTIEFNATASVNIGNVTVGTDTFQFPTTVIDSRAVSAGSTVGWRLQAISTGLISGANSISLKINGSNSPTSTCTITTSTTSNCTGFTSTPISLPGTTESTPQTFASESGTDGDGTYTLSTGGEYQVLDTTPSGSYSATITLSLLDSF
jgi:hypothetical protein